ncbi:hypothetical protein [Streptomyces sp. NPDC050355]|uniref:hypothetical protein n=1 Tax=Streptomyces sp. NPDC050355 TaxID=3365609 RepID=UPI00378960E4
MGRRRGLGPDFTKDDGDDGDGGDGGADRAGAGGTGETDATRRTTLGRAAAGRAADGRRGVRPAVPPPPVRRGEPVRDRTWLPELRAAIWCTAGLFTVMLLVDLANGTLDPWRALCWTAVALVLFTVLYPPRVTAGEHWLASRGPVRTRTVRTDLLVLVRRGDGVAPRLVLRDALGGRVELDPKVLTANPLLWHRLERGVRRSREHGWLRCGAVPMQALADRIDHDGARAVFDASGLE